MAVVNKQANLIIFTGICLAMSLGIMAVKYGMGHDPRGTLPDAKDYIGMFNVKVEAAAGSVDYNSALIGGKMLSLWDESSFEFTTDKDGDGAIPFAVASKKPRANDKQDVRLLFSMKPASLGYRADEKESTLTVGGLRPNSTYRMEAALWMVDNSNMAHASKKNYEVAGALDCADKCLLALGEPQLMSLGVGSAPERIAVRAFSHTPFGLPLALAVGLFAWRARGRDWARPALEAAGLGDKMAMAVKSPRVG